jgi:hypothetical protein
MSDFPPSEKVRVLLAEHAGLRAEIVARIGHSYQLLAVGTTAMTLFIALSTMPHRRLYWAIVIAIGMIFSFALWVCWRDSQRAAARIREIEIDVNDRVGEDLLVWENLWGGGRTGLWWSAVPRAREILKAAQKPRRTRAGEPVHIGSPQTETSSTFG